METRVYRITGSVHNLEKIEKLLRHMEYLGNIGASRNILVRVDGDGDGRIRVRNKRDEKIDNDQYSQEQKIVKTAVVGMYDIE